ncbi:MAG TPA: N-acetylglucosamine-6-phosphate deacetylase, partial [Rudaea sp.]|nr:N-acetylglucosamine-6-phosphate deacetylase [Rudaea sp.]
MTRAFVNGRVLSGERFLAGNAVLVDGGRIGAVVDAADPRVRGAEVHDLNGASLVPGFIDCQVNGGGGVLFNDAPGVDAVRRIGAAHARFGTT